MLKDKRTIDKIEDDLKEDEFSFKIDKVIWVWIMTAISIISSYYLYMYFFKS